MTAFYEGCVVGRLQIFKAGSNFLVFGFFIRELICCSWHSSLLSHFWYTPQMFLVLWPIVAMMISFAGCTVDEIRKGPFYWAAKTNETLIDLFVKNATELKVPLDDSPSDMLASTDMGNVSRLNYLFIH